MRPRWTEPALDMARRLLPLEVRVAVRRAPHVARWLTAPRPRRGDTARFPFVMCARRSPLRRPGTTYSDALQGGKETNVRRAASLVDGALVFPGERLSFHHLVGPPVRARGFAPGPELHGEAMALGVGGGLCQVANLVLWLAVHADFDVVERHRHALDLFPDASRDVPFGLGATVFFPTKDLVVSHRGRVPALFRVEVVGGWLTGQVRLPYDPGVHIEVREEGSAFVRGPDGSIVRHNRLVRVRREGDVVREEALWENAASVAYPVDPAP